MDLEQDALNAWHQVEHQEWRFDLRAGAVAHSNHNRTSRAVGDVSDAQAQPLPTESAMRPSERGRLDSFSPLQTRKQLVALVRVSHVEPAGFDTVLSNPNILCIAPGR